MRKVNYKPELVLPVVMIAVSLARVVVWILV